MNSYFDFENIKLIQLFLSGILACFLALKAIPVIITISRLKNLMAEPGERHSHEAKTPTLGGVAIFAATLISYFIWKYDDEEPLIHVSISAIIILFFLGVKDDILVLSPKKKIIIQVLVAAMVTILGPLQIDNFFGILGINEIPGIMSFFLTILIFISLINAINLIDGIDGLAGGIGLLAGLFFGIWFYLSSHYSLAYLAISMSGALLGFLRYNFSIKNKIFMGDTGSLIVGFLLSMFVIKFVQINVSYHYDPSSLYAAPILAIVTLIVPIFDTLRVFIIRLKNRKSPFLGDRNHLHHILIDLGLSHLKASIYLWIFTAVAMLFFGVLSFNNCSNSTCFILLAISFFIYLMVANILKNKIGLNEKKAQISK
ncbi:MAG: undecaprenyl/decaprenyl-phosphate alpha-N-acetylglucosaminyl 1-phosphate transferase [Pseudarcicella sp.]|nr:undecaprenyl/decaprenyl-phosphate alpha-N-acetylglucosaminyl 1-phosphate transferase [Pseudarcicella sp.]MBP6410682.1 undecaprenyl/decaprenyl-phosphate alpha-N-acetylglucosaminyl 1-phosphate transferase [Pseudarcicella sp.]